MATLHIRNVPVELFEQLQRWADEAKRSINAEVIELLRQESDRRHEESDTMRRLKAYFEKYGDQPVESNAVALIREDRDRGHKPEFGY